MSKKLAIEIIKLIKDKLTMTPHQIKFRDKCAMRAMQCYISDYIRDEKVYSFDHESISEHVVTIAFDTADLMLKEKLKRDKELQNSK